MAHASPHEQLGTGAAQAALEKLRKIVAFARELTAEASRKADAGELAEAANDDEQATEKYAEAAAYLHCAKRMLEIIEGGA